ncbi:hypothetical protein F5Y19DRAFT_429679 [Xylariaceae sp. FL1651]|nr:hypothetical protein F5Y19DRAFT_429679 [Xylariaceae sp. FL1651]
MYKKDNMDSAWPARALYFSLCLLFVAEVVAASSSLKAVPAKPSLVGNTFVDTFMGFIYGLVGAVWFAILLGTTFYRLEYKHQYLRKIVIPIAAAVINFQFLIYGCYLMAIYGDPLLRYAIYANVHESDYYDAVHDDLGMRFGATEAQELITVLICGFLLGSTGFDMFSAIVGITKFSATSPNGSIV